jgi:hypothetical protein
MQKSIDTFGSLGDVVAKPRRDADPYREDPGAPDFPVARKHPGGRPPIAYDPAIADQICDRIAHGEVLGEILREEGMPSRTAVLHWLDRVPEFEAAYTRARGSQADAVAERGFAEAWAAHEPQYVYRARLRFDAAKWLASRLDPAKWSDKAELRVHVNDTESSARRAELIAALQRLAVNAPMTTEGEKPADE